MLFNTRELIHKVPEYKEFLTLNELDRKAIGARKYGFYVEKIGNSLEGRPIYRVGTGQHKEKKALIWGFLHPNEPVGSLTIDFLVNYLGNNKKELQNSEYEWNFIYTADPDGTLLNEGWFKGSLDLKKYFLNYYRPSPDRQIEWTFPVQYKDFKWEAKLPETLALMELMKKEKFDFMYPLHNAGLGGAYFFSTKDFDNEYYENIISLADSLNIPLHMGEPEESFIKVFRKPFYKDFGFKEYYEEQKELGRTPQEVLKHGDNSTNYLLSINPAALVITGEIPYFYDPAISNNKESNKTRREAWLKMLNENTNQMEYAMPIINKTLSILRESDPYFPLMKWHLGIFERGTEAQRKQVISSPDFNKNATSAELFSTNIISAFERALMLGQIRRASIKAKLESQVISGLENKILDYASFIEKNSNLSAFPIKKLVQLQLGVFSEAMNFLQR